MNFQPHHTKYLNNAKAPEAFAQVVHHTREVLQHVLVANGAALEYSPRFGLKVLVEVSHATYPVLNTVNIFTTEQDGIPVDSTSAVPVYFSRNADKDSLLSELQTSVREYAQKQKLTEKGFKVRVYIDPADGGHGNAIPNTNLLLHHHQRKKSFMDRGRHDSLRILSIKQGCFQASKHFFHEVEPVVREDHMLLHL